MAKKPKSNKAERDTEREMETRRGDGRFAPGWKGGPGGARLGAGRKPDEAKQKFRAMLETLDELAQARLAEMLSGEIKPNVGKEGNAIEGEFVLVTDPRVVMRAIEHVQNHLHGKPTVHVQIENDDTHLSDTIDRAKAARVASSAAKYQRAGKAHRSKNE